MARAKAEKRTARKTKPKALPKPLTAPLGAHISIAGGTHNAPPRAATIGATAMQIFTKMANRWAERACEGEECVGFRAAIKVTDVRETTAHDSYLINLASPDPILRARSFESFVAELQRGKALGLNYLVSHPGNLHGRPRERACEECRIDRCGVRACRRKDDRADGDHCGIRHLHRRNLRGNGRAHRAGPEVRTEEGRCLHRHGAHLSLPATTSSNDYDAVMTRFDDVIGFERLRMMHLNDSKAPLASRRDRHELIAEGAIGEGAFRRIMNDPRLARVAKVIETPKTIPDVTDREMLERLRSYVE